MKKSQNKIKKRLFFIAFIVAVIGYPKVFAYNIAASKQNEEKPQNSDNKQVAYSQDEYPECLERCFRICDRVYSKYNERRNNAMQDYINSIHGIIGSGSKGTLDSANKWSDNRERRMEREQRRLDEAVTRCDSRQEACINDCDKLR